MLVNVGKLMSHTSTKGGGGVKHPFNPSLVDAWFMSGLSNNDKPSSIRGVKGNDLALKNFAYSFSSGFGKYTVDFTKYVGSNTTSNSISIYKEAGIDKGFATIAYSHLESDIPSYSIEIKGLDSGQILYYYRNNEGLEKNVTYNKDGIYELPICYKEGEKGTSAGFTINSVNNITITQLPSAYEGALVFDGVDDYGICNNLPILNDYTVICRREIINKESGAIASKRTSSSQWNGAFIFERNNQLTSFGQNNYRTIQQNNVSYMTTTSYNGDTISRGSLQDTEYLVLGADGFDIDLNRAHGFSNCAIYYFALYNKSLTPEEVEEEKIKLENYWEGGKNELA